MNDHFADIFTETACPSQDKLMAYVKGELGASERHEVEMHMQDCEMCAEAVEGLSAISRKDQIPGWLRQAKWNVLHTLRRKNRRKKKENYYLYIVIVSLVILFMAIALWWIYHFARQ
ncbi:anti-sigma factor family protein [Chitinophaga deserti]|uniref:anti-sigma factor family protein n=1 Tax=Chitinophaga deserti TaxID=2164099 RepID=UPI000D6A8307|nr:zf-HC2 domain-containing protein [Chitinophaga deserti]